VRESLSLLAPFFLISTSVILYSRVGSTSDDFSLIVPIPLLAALGVFPVVGPFLLFFLEVIGTARVLVTVHPYASSTDSLTESGATGRMLPRTRLLLRYIVATCLSRLSLWRFADWTARLLRRICPCIAHTRLDSEIRRLVRVPPASLNLLEKLGVATAFTLIDDELVCEPHAIPQQLLIPSGMGLKLFDLCPTYDDAVSDDDGRSESISRRNRGKSFDSDSSDDGSSQVFPLVRRKSLRWKNQRVLTGDDDSEMTSNTLFEVQFEDPTWWQYLPSLKCIGLACLMRDEGLSVPCVSPETGEPRSFAAEGNGFSTTAKSALVGSVCRGRQDKQLGALAQCIGFSTHCNKNEPKGDMSAFEVQMRLHIISSSLVQERLVRDAHERSIEQSRWWGLIRPDSTSVVLQDKRTTAFQLLTVGDPSVVIDLCNEAWQGEISTILPLGAMDRHTIIETTNNWKLADLDVSAFSYSPVPRSLEPRLSLNPYSEVSSMLVVTCLFVLKRRSCVWCLQGFPSRPHFCIRPQSSLAKGQDYVGGMVVYEKSNFPRRPRIFGCAAKGDTESFEHLARCRG
jgi:hypothetical protein